MSDPPQRTWQRLLRLAVDLARTDGAGGDRALQVAERLVAAARLSPQVSIGQRLIYQLAAPPRALRGLGNLVVRRGELSDLEALVTVDRTDRELIRQRFARGDLAYVGQLDGRVLCHVWFHPGPAPFTEDRAACASWALAAGAWWSYNGAAAGEVRASGVFVKLFIAALRELFETHRAQRIQSFVHAQNQASIAMHERLGWERLGVFLTVAVPGLKLVRWDGAGGRRVWLRRRAADLALPLPPV